MTVLPDARVNKNLQGPSLRAKVQRFGGFLASMIMPNIGAFIAWGLITAFFLKTGWTPNDHLAAMISPMLTYLLTLLIAYSGGNLVHGQRGAVIGTIATMGVIVGAEMPMFLGAMIVGPLAAWILKKFDQLINGKVKAGFEMLVDNFSTGILGMVLAIAANYAIGPAVRTLVTLLGKGVQTLVDAHLLPLVSVLVEPGKVLFLNNAINHGIFSPLGAQQAQETGRSILFMIESNPGAGLGLLLAFMLFGPKKLRPATGGALVIHFFGGIHEIYFPYVLMKPITIVATILGSVTGLLVGSSLGAGLVAPASPGSILAYIAVTPAGGFVPMLATVGSAAVVSFVVCSVLLKFGRGADDEAEVADTVDPSALDLGSLSRVYIACDAGMGSSVMVSSVMKKKLAPYHVEVTHTPIDRIPSDARLVMTQSGLAERARKANPNATVIAFDSYTSDPAFDHVERIVAQANGVDAGTGASSKPALTRETSTGDVAALLSGEAIRLGLVSESKEEAIRRAGELLVKQGAVSTDYVDAMFTRETEISTYLDNGVAIPHGTNASRQHIKRTALAVLQYPDGVNWDGNEVKLVVAIASSTDEHVGILAQLAQVLVRQDKVEVLQTSKDIEQVRALLSPQD